MATETKPIPKIALSAIRMMQEAHHAQLRVLADQTAEAMQIDSSWALDLAKGVAIREVPDVPPSDVVATS